MSANLENSLVATGLEGQFSFQSLRKAMPKNVRTTTQLHSFHILAKWKWSHIQLFATPWTRLLRPWDFLGKSTWVSCHFLLQGVLLTQGSNPGPPRCRQMLYHLSHQGMIYVYFLLILQQHESVRSIYISPLCLPPSVPPPTPSRSSQSTQLNSLCHATAPH